MLGYDRKHLRMVLFWFWRSGILSVKSFHDLINEITRWMFDWFDPNAVKHLSRRGLLQTIYGNYCHLLVITLVAFYINQMIPWNDTSHVLSHIIGDKVLLQKFTFTDLVSSCSCLTIFCLLERQSRQERKRGKQSSTPPPKSAAVLIQDPYG